MLWLRWLEGLEVQTVDAALTSVAQSATNFRRGLEVVSGRLEQLRHGSGIKWGDKRVQMQEVGVQVFSLGEIINNWPRWDELGRSTACRALWGGEREQASDSFQKAATVRLCSQSKRKQTLVEREAARGRSDKEPSAELWGWERERDLFVVVVVFGGLLGR